MVITGGLALLWKKSLQCQITNYSSHFINVELTNNIIGNWRLTGFYGFPNRPRRRNSWNLLRTLASLSDLPSCIIRDFNDILFADDKCGRATHPSWLFQGFREVVSYCNLIDFPLSGYPFT